MLGRQAYLSLRPCLFGSVVRLSEATCLMVLGEQRKEAEGSAVSYCLA